MKLDIRRAHVPIEGLDLSQSFALSLETFFEAQKSITPHLRQLLQQLNHSDNPVTCLVSDVCMTTPTQHLADAFSLPRIVFFPSSQSSQLLWQHLITDPTLTTKRALEVVARQAAAEADEVFAEGLEGLPTFIRAADLPNFRHVVDDNVYVFEFMEREMLQCFHKAHSVVVNSFDALEGPAFKALSARVKIPIYGVGPLVEPLEEHSTTSLWKEDQTCMLWLDKQPPLSVLYISFGSVTLLSPSQFEEIVHGLLSSQQRFLWVLRPDLVETTGHESGKRTLDLLAQSQGQGCIVDWVPQLRVLGHSSIGGFLTHCGWNSTTEAISNGVPMLCWPYFADQHLDAKFIVEEWRAGLRFNMNNERGVIERSEIERVIKKVMEGEDGKILRENARKLKEASTRALSPQGTSYMNIQALLNSLDV
ncbi:hypothetical protein GOP47_0010738 [Adiantum capillus-veneris]|uniref:Glycosyltransferase n=1 Tax=Adiantum capillus-veneris TaxID=13818 RepID=A0A9D4UVW2_ADICA|nr:hypothetical protein GOP47_0010738 [Adiantum capillus-veneris]